MSKEYKNMRVTLHGYYVGSDQTFEFEVPVDATEEEKFDLAWNAVMSNVEITVEED